MNFNKFLSLGLALSLMFGISACKNSKDVTDEESSVKKWETAKIVGTVGDDNIYDAEFKFYFNMNKSQIEKDAGLDDKSDEEKKKFWEEKDGNGDKKQKLLDKTFDDLVNLKILLNLAKIEGVKLDESDSMQIERNIYNFTKNKANENQDEAEKLMKQMYGVSIDEYRWIFEDYFTAYYKYANNEIAKMEVSDKEIEERFERDKDDFSKVNVRHVLLYTIDIDTQQPLEEDVINEKRQLAEDIFKRVKEGESIEDLAKQYSENADLKITGGAETLTKGDTVAELENWVFNAKEGDVGLIETSYGIHVVKVINSIEATLGDEEKATIRGNLQNEKFQKRLEEEKAKIQIVKEQEAIDSLDLF